MANKKSLGSGVCEQVGSVGSRQTNNFLRPAFYISVLLCFIKEQLSIVIYIYINLKCRKNI